MKVHEILSPREIEIIQQIANGLTDREVGALLEISDKTASTHRKNILHKLQIKNTALLIRYALENKWVK
ncbi:MAG TPA: LuxR C-terminal-related transcriptional regulator [Bacteroidia bacterium]|nr:response regulator transcription factor [Bacteroidota bacterium]HRC32470.1 LuxR C-terminal-related transcriptional regulator [Bacteroidia bacterium]